ncbi:MAG: hypothetical protein ABIK18_05610, partial [candidate division WOR-3 bacterium]
YAYVADRDSGLRVIDVSNPANPNEVGYYNTLGEANGVAVVGSYAYVADERAGLRVISIADPAHPNEVGYYDTPGYALGVAVSGNYAYVADYYAGLRIIEFYGQGIEEGFQPTANRSRQTATIVRNVLRWEKTGDRRPMTDDGSAAFLVDVTGRKVFDLKPGENDVRHLSPGVYFIRSGSGIDRRVVIAR